MGQSFIKKLEECGIEDVPEVGGKNASLGEMIQNLTPLGIKIPGGYAVTASAYRYFLEETKLKDFIKKTLQGLDTKNLDNLSKKAKEIREKIKKTSFPEDLKTAISLAHKEIEKRFGKNTSFAVRSSATAEDLPDASFAGEHETYLNISGTENILKAVRDCFASLFTDRAISYRVDKNFDHFKVALSVGVQKMVRSDKACSGVMFTLDTESGFPGVVIINGSWGLGEMVVQGRVTPDEFLIFKKTDAIIEKKLGVKNQKMIYGDRTFTKTIATTQKEKDTFVLDEKEVLKLAKWGDEVEKHYSKKKGKWTPMDLEWAKDGESNELFIVQARPETIHSSKDFSKIEEYKRLEEGELIVEGASVGNKIASGSARVILSPSDIKLFRAKEILVTCATDPDWEPIMKIASAIVTDQGGRTSHAAIVSRELGIPAVVGTVFATEKIKTGDKITVDTTGSVGLVYRGELKFKVEESDTKKLPKTKTKIMMNIATPGTAFEKSFLPNDGVGLLREEFIIAGDIGIHPLACINYHKLPISIKNQIDKKTIGYPDKVEFYIAKLSEGIGKIAAAFYPKPVVARFSDFKTNEYRTLIGGDLYEPEEANPMIGWRGASRYYHPEFAPAFILEIKAYKWVIEEMGLTNVIPMIPFCRTPEEGKKVLEIMKKNGLDTKTYVMCEIPSNVILADEFLKVFDGMSIGSNDLTQLTLGIDRDGNEKIRGISNENDPAVKELISQVIKKCKAKDKYIGICGQAPSDYPEFAQFLVREGIDSISLNPDSIIKTIPKISEAEKK
ncbi:phosphoenolpyruvate synthase [Candidatus Daviesbacteria bacterium RIFOXYD1_FULL_41_10]|uniref:Phosphoenolpyruvate synthase n=1 Tax=Candidatus Daviesbacteria bacterium RIFOXYD1_FULL_41_10 TaxID=1797801 RepID=A0A1F5N0Q5_9BACT|nr:MAG: phosphoenolpyruvate synthase [Candidatus Daviesbacteria bacterium RIFOXYD1_FULL_41_10]